MSTVARRAALHRILEEHRVASQSQAAELLGEAGFSVTQATVSRDLTAIGAVKATDDEGAHYRFGEHPTGALGSTLDRFVVDVAPSGNLVVVKTEAGAAHYVASTLDRSAIPEIIGTVAGDDTVIVVAAPGSTGTSVARLLLGEGNR
jgi:transcriptional regulator of arginine metabolism